jgi:hypothetical protein
MLRARVELPHGPPIVFGMYSRADEYRRRGIRAQQLAERAADRAPREAFEEVATEWFALAEQAEWLDRLYDEYERTIAQRAAHD